MQKKQIFIAGHLGMVGSALLRSLKRRENLQLICKDKKELNLLDFSQVLDFFSNIEIDQIYLAAAKVGGIIANDTYPADFIFENLSIQNNIIKAAHTAKIQKILFLGSSCIYPKLAAQPLGEDSLLKGPLETTNEPYAIAKIAGIKMCESFNRQYGTDYRSVMPTNLYGPNDNFHSENSHVIPALLRRFHLAKKKNSREVVVWGTGKSMREFMYVDDMAEACIYVMELSRNEIEQEVKASNSHINIGTGIDCTIFDLAKLISNVTGFKGKITFDKSKPDGTPRKKLNVDLLNRLGWRSSISLEKGLKLTYDWFLAKESSIRK